MTFQIGRRKSGVRLSPANDGTTNNLYWQKAGGSIGASTDKVTFVAALGIRAYNPATRMLFTTANARFAIQLITSNALLSGPRVTASNSAGTSIINLSPQSGIPLTPRLGIVACSIDLSLPRATGFQMTIDDVSVVPSSGTWTQGSTIDFSNTGGNTRFAGTNSTSVDDLDAEGCYFALCLGVVLPVNTALYNTLRAMADLNFVGSTGDMEFLFGKEPEVCLYGTPAEWKMTSSSTLNKGAGGTLPFNAVIGAGCSVDSRGLPDAPPASPGAPTGINLTPPVAGYTLRLADDFIRTAAATPSNGALNEAGKAIVNGIAANPVWTSSGLAAFAHGRTNTGTGEMQVYGDNGGTTLTFNANRIRRANVLTSGQNYVRPVVAVSYNGTGGVNPQVKFGCLLDKNRGIEHISVLYQGNANFTLVPTVTITDAAGVGTGATATVEVTGASPVDYVLPASVVEPFQFLENSGHGVLRLWLKKVPEAYRDSTACSVIGALITSKGWISNQYGYVRIKFRAGGGHGSFPALWAVGDNNSFANGPYWESDFCELIGSNPKYWTSTFWQWGDRNPLAGSVTTTGASTTVTGTNTSWVLASLSIENKFVSGDTFYIYAQAAKTMNGPYTVASTPSSSTSLTATTTPAAVTDGIIYKVVAAAAPYSTKLSRLQTVETTDKWHLLEYYHSPTEISVKLDGTLLGSDVSAEVSPGNPHAEPQMLASAATPMVLIMNNAGGNGDNWLLNYFTPDTDWTKTYIDIDYVEWWKDPLW